MSDAAEAAIERLLAGSEERVRRFEEGLKNALPENRKRFRNRDYVNAEKLEALLMELRDDGIEPSRGFSAILAFYRADATLIEEYEDSSGSLEFLYDHAAAEILASFACRLPESHVLEKLSDLLADDPYGLRLAILKRANRFLSEAGLRELAAKFQGGQPEREERRFAQLSEEIAKQLNDPALLEAAILRQRPEMKPDDYVHLAQAHLHCEEHQKALDRLNQDPNGKAAASYDGTRIKLACLKSLGQTVEHQIAAWERFAEYPEVDRFENLVSEVGEERREALEERASEFILADPTFRTKRVLLLLHLGRAKQAEQRTLEHHEKLSEEFYGDLRDLAEGFRAASKDLAATLCFRALLNEILLSKRSKAYHHAADYYRALEELAGRVTDWGNFASHSEYVGALRAHHGRKYGFWSRVEASPTPSP